MAASTSARLPAVTPVMPRLANAASVRAGLALPPAAVTSTPLAVAARVLISLTKSTAVATCAPRLSLSKARALTPWVVLWAARPMSAPMAA